MGDLEHISDTDGTALPPEILVADDDGALRELLRSVLEEAGYRVRTVADGRSALAAIQQHSPDIVLCDLMMPAMGGEDLAAELRRDETAAKIPLIAMSATQGMAAQADAGGASPFAARLEKPLEIPKLLATIASVVKRKKSIAAKEALAKARSGWSEKFSRQADEELGAEIARLNSLPRSGTELESIKAVRQLAHRLSGSCGMFGFADAGDLARDLEHAVIERLGGDKTIDEREIESIAANLARIRERLGAAKDSAKKAEDARAAIPAVYEAAAAASAAVASEKIALLLYDEPELAAAVAQTAKQHGFRVECFESVPAALARMGEQTFAVITVGGYRIASNRYVELAAFRERAPETPLFVLSRDDSTSERIAAVRAGADHFLDVGTDATGVASAWVSVLNRVGRVAGRVLCLDDDPHVRAFVEAELGAAGCEVFTLDGAASVFEKLPAIEPMLVLTDLDMPNVDGIAMIKALRASARWSTLPVIAMTAHAAPERRATAYAAGIDDWIGKPLVAPELVARVTGRLDRERMKRDALEKDSLTGLYNRELFFARTGVAVEAALHKSRELALATVEFENLAAFVHAHGLEAGDLAVCTVAKRIAEVFATTVHTMGRLASNVLAVVQYDTGTHEMIARLEAGLKTLEREQELAPRGPESLGLSLAVGVSACREGVSLREIVDRSIKAKAKPRRITVTEVSPVDEAERAPVFVIEDDPVLSEMLQYALARRGCSVFLYQTGDEALNALLEAPEHDTRPVVLLDIDLPHVNGLTILKTIDRERPGYYQVVLMTAHGAKHDQLELARSSAVDYVTKPVDLELLVESVLKRLGSDGDD